MTSVKYVARVHYRVGISITTGSPQTVEQKIRTRHPSTLYHRSPRRLCGTSIPRLDDSRCRLLCSAIVLFPSPRPQHHAHRIRHLRPFYRTVLIGMEGWFVNPPTTRASVGSATVETSRSFKVRTSASRLITGQSILPCESRPPCGLIPVLSGT